MISSENNEIKSFIFQIDNFVTRKYTSRMYEIFYNHCNYIMEIYFYILSII